MEAIDDVGLLCQAVATATAERVMARLAAAGYGDVRASHGYVFEGLVAGDTTVTQLAQRLGVDETRRGRPRWRWDEQTGSWETVCDRWHVGFVDLSGGHGLLGQVEGRTKASVIGWLDERGPAWKQQVKVVAIDMCSVFKSAIGHALPDATIVATTRAGIDLIWTPSDKPHPVLRISEAVPVGILLAACLVLTVFAGPAMRYMERTGRSLADRQGYIESVLARPAAGAEASRR